MEKQCYRLHSLTHNLCIQFIEHSEIQKLQYSRRTMSDKHNYFFELLNKQQEYLNALLCSHEGAYISPNCNCVDVDIKNLKSTVLYQ